MKNTLFYVFIGLIVINIFVNGLMNFINLVLAGILLRILTEKEKSGSFSTWKLILGIGITVCNLLVRLAIMSGLIQI